MVSSVIFSPTKAFEEAFSNVNISGAIITVVLSALFLGLAAYWVSANLTAGVYFFISTIVQFLVLCALVWFFEFIHVRKRKMMVGTAFSKIVSVVGKIWLINLIGSIIFALMAFLVTHLNYFLLEIIGVIALVLTIVLVVAWIVASFRMLKVVLGVARGKLLINWIILNILNALISSFIVALIAGILFKL